MVAYTGFIWFPPLQNLVPYLVPKPVPIPFHGTGWHRVWHWVGTGFGIAAEWRLKRARGSRGWRPVSLFALVEIAAAWASGIVDCADLAADKA
jgi:hypothetical protein